MSGRRTPRPTARRSPPRSSPRVRRCCAARDATRRPRAGGWPRPRGRSAKGVGRVDIAAALGVAKRVRAEPAPPQRSTESDAAAEAQAEAGHAAVTGSPPATHRASQAGRVTRPPSAPSPPKPARSRPRIRSPRSRRVPSPPAPSDERRPRSSALGRARRPSRRRRARVAAGRRRRACCSVSSCGLGGYVTSRRSALSVRLTGNGGGSVAWRHSRSSATCSTSRVSSSGVTSQQAPQLHRVADVGVPAGHAPDRRRGRARRAATAPARVCRVEIFARNSSPDCVHPVRTMNVSGEAALSCAARPAEVLGQLGVALVARVLLRAAPRRAASSRPP